MRVFGAETKAMRQNNHFRFAFAAVVFLSVMLFNGRGQSSQPGPELQDSGYYEFVPLDELIGSPEKYNNKTVATTGVYSYSALKSYYLRQGSSLMRGVELTFAEDVEEINPPAGIRHPSLGDETMAWEAVFQTPSLLEHYVVYTTTIYGTFLYQPSLRSAPPKIAVKKIVYANKINETVRDPRVKKDIVKKLRRLFADKSLVVEEILADYETSIFVNYKLLRITVSSGRLEHRLLPSRKTRGMFAYGRNRLIYLNHANTNFEKLFWEERHLRPADMDPERVAKALVLCKVSQRNIGLPLVKDIEDILAYEFRGYAVDREKVLRYRDIIVAPRWEVREKTKDLVFFALSGWQHQVETLIKITASFAKSSFNVEITKTALEESVFKKVPRIMY